MAGGHYDQSLYNEFVKVLDRLDTMKKETDQKIAGLNKEISDLKKENKKLQKENELPKEDNTRLKNLLNHDSSNTSKPPSSDQKPARAANNYNNREKSEKILLTAFDPFVGDKVNPALEAVKSPS